MQRSQVKTSISPANAGGRIGQPALTELLAHIFAQPLTLLGQADATVSTYAIFWCIAFNEGQTQVAIAEITGTSPKTVSRVISQLGEYRDGLGWVEQRVDEVDRRVRRLYLSKKGNTLQKKMLKQLATIQTATLKMQGNNQT